MLYEKIMVSTDGSKYSEGAIREAINMAKSCDSRLFLMSVIEINAEFIALAPEALEKIESKTKKYLEEIRNRAAKENVKCEIIIREGEGPYSFIMEEAKKKNAELIVMGRRGRTGLVKVLMGSSTARVIGHIDPPSKILVVPKDTVIKWENIVVATDGSKYSKAAAKEAISVAKRYRGTSTLNVIAVTRKGATKERIQESEKALEEIKLNAEKENIKVNTLYVKDQTHESIADTIVKHAKDKNADIIVMGTYGRKGIQKLLMGSVTAGVIGQTSSAVLVVKG